MRSPRSPLGSFPSSFIGRIVLVGLLGIYTPFAAKAVPAAAGLAELTQPDGTRIRAKLAGDEWFSWNETEDGYVIGKDNDGRWKYRRARPDQAAFEFVPGAVVGKVNPTALGLRKHDLPRPALIRQRVRALRGADLPLLPRAGQFPLPLGLPNPTSRGPAPTEGAASAEATTDTTATTGHSAADEPPSSATSPVANNIRCVVILAAFDDHWDPIAGAPLALHGLPHGNYDALLNQPGHSSDGAVGSARDYYHEVSYGRTDITFLVSNWVRLPHSESYYGDNSNEVSGESRARLMAAHAVAAADAAGYDFAQADGNTDGWVDMLVVIHSGYSEAHPGNSPSSLWPRQWTLPSVDTRDGKSLNAFAATSAMRGLQSSGGSIMRIGTLVHEIGHLFGLPDLYDVGGVTKGIGAWGLMAYGGWGASGGAATEHQPTHMEAFSKMILGYLDPQPVHTCNEHALPRLATSPAAHVLRASTAEDEYFLVENRGGAGFDSGLPAGLLITHIDSRVLTVANNSAVYSTPAIRVEEADGGDTLRTFGGTSASHVWTASNGLIGGFRDDTGDPHTNAMRYQPNGGSFAYERIIDPAFYSGIVASNFSSPGAFMTYRLQTRVPTLASPPATTGGYTVSWSDSTDAERYELQEGTPFVASSFYDDAESIASLREQWEIFGAVSQSTLGNATPGGSFSYELAGILPGPDGVINTSDDYYMPEHRGLGLRMPFALTPSTVLSFKYLSRRAANHGPLRVQLTPDDGVTWTTLGTYEGYTGTWTTATLGYAQLQSAGFTADDVCRLRFITTVEQLFGWNAFPAYGFALDDIELTGIARDATAWTTISDNFTATEHTVSSKPDQSAWRYRVRAYTDFGWQDWSSVATIDVNYSPLASWRQTHFGTTDNTGDFADTADYDRDGLDNLMEYALNGVPVSATDTPAPVPHVANNRLHLTFLRARSDIIYTIEGSSDLASWTALATDSGTVSLETPVTVADTVDLSIQPRRFLRLRVTR